MRHCTSHRPFVKPRSSLLFSPYVQQPPLLDSLSISRGREFIRSRRDVNRWHDLSSNLTHLYTLYAYTLLVAYLTGNPRTASFPTINFNRLFGCSYVCLNFAPLKKLKVKIV